MSQEGKKQQTAHTSLKDLQEGSKHSKIYNILTKNEAECRTVLRGTEELQKVKYGHSSTAYEFNRFPDIGDAQKHHPFFHFSVHDV